jgi:hypothetical protein
MTSTKKYVGMDVHKESISIALMNSVGKIVMECVLETKASMILQFINGLRGDVRINFEEGTWAAWLYDLLKPHVSEVVVCNPRKNALMKDGSKSDRIDARKLAGSVTVRVNCGSLDHEGVPIQCPSHGKTEVNFTRGCYELCTQLDSLRVVVC